MAADRTGATVSAICAAVSAAHFANGFAASLIWTRLLLAFTDGLRTSKSALRPPRWASSHGGAETKTAGERVRGELHIQTVKRPHEAAQSSLRSPSRRRHKYLRQAISDGFIFAVLPKATTHPRRPAAAAVEIPAGWDQFA